MKFCIREIRKMRNMTQEELAKRAVVARTVLSSLEKEPDTSTNTATLEKLAGVLQVPAAQLIESPVQKVNGTLVLTDDGEEYIGTSFDDAKEMMAMIWPYLRDGTKIRVTIEVPQTSSGDGASG